MALGLFVWPVTQGDALGWYDGAPLALGEILRLDDCLVMARFGRWAKCASGIALRRLPGDGAPLALGEMRIGH